MYSGDLAHNIVGKPAKDIYGREIGKVVGVALDFSGDRAEFYVAHWDGRLVEYPYIRVIVEPEALVVVPEWKVELERAKKEIDYAKKRVQAVEELFRSGDIDREVYEDLHKQYEEMLASQVSKLSEIAGKIKDRLSSLPQDLRGHEKALVNLKMQHKAGEVDNVSYRDALEFIQLCIEALANERRDLENALHQLSTLQASTSTTQQPIHTQATTAHEASEPSSSETLSYRVEEEEQTSRDTLFVRIMDGA